MDTRNARHIALFISSDTSCRVLLILCSLLFVLFGYARWNGLWGFNHLRFLPSAFHIAAWCAFALLLPITFRRAEPIASRLVLYATDAFFGRPRWLWRIGFALLAGNLFWFLRAPTHFLGDGATWLANFSHEAGYVRKWTEFGSIHFIRSLQDLLGGYTQSTAKAAFQTVSVAAGLIVLLAFFPLVGRLVRHKANRFAAVATMAFAGTSLLFFGYVEFYPLLWAVTSLFLLAAIIWLQDRNRLALVAALSLFGAALAVHIQVVWLSGAILVLLPGLIVKRDSEVDPKRVFLLVAFLALGALALYTWILLSPPNRSWMVLPPLTGRIESSDYAALSPKHLGDLLNLLLVLFPGALVLLPAILRPGRQKTNPVSAFLAVASCGGLLFVLLLNPVIGLGRDWDLMSLAVLPPLLWLFHRLDRAERTLTNRTALGLGLLALMTGATFCAANLRTASSETRYLSLLRWYGGKDYNGWKMFETYLTDAGRSEDGARLAAEMQAVFPQQALLTDGWRYLQSGQTARARHIAGLLIAADPNRAEYLHFLGESCLAEGQVGEAEQHFRQALRNRPDYGPTMRSMAQLRMRAGDLDDARELLRRARRADPAAEMILEDLGAVYLRLNNLDSARAVADTLLSMNDQAPGGHLIAMLAAVQGGDQTAARAHFLAYREYGRDRPEYRQILASYSDLASGS